MTGAKRAAYFRVGAYIFCAALIVFISFSGTIFFVDAQTSGSAFCKTPNAKNANGTFVNNQPYKNEGKVCETRGKCVKGECKLQNDKKDEAKGVDKNGQPVGSVQPTTLPNCQPGTPGCSNIGAPGDFNPDIFKVPLQPSAVNGGLNINDAFNNGGTDPYDTESTQNKGILQRTWDYLTGGTPPAEQSPGANLPPAPNGVVPGGGVGGILPQSGQVNPQDAGYGYDSFYNPPNTESTFGYVDESGMIAGTQEPGFWEKVGQGLKETWRSLTTEKIVYGPTDSGDQLKQPPSNPEFNGVPGAAEYKLPYDFEKNPPPVIDYREPLRQAAANAKETQEALDKFAAENGIRKVVTKPKDGKPGSILYEPPKDPQKAAELKRLLEEANIYAKDYQMVRQDYENIPLAERVQNAFFDVPAQTAQAQVDDAQAKLDALNRAEADREWYERILPSSDRSLQEQYKRAIAEGQKKIKQLKAFSEYLQKADNPDAVAELMSKTPENPEQDAARQLLYQNINKRAELTDARDAYLRNLGIDQQGPLGEYAREIPVLVEGYNKHIAKLDKQIGELTGQYEMSPETQRYLAEKTGPPGILQRTSDFFKEQFKLGMEDSAKGEWLSGDVRAFGSSMAKDWLVDPVARLTGNLTTDQQLRNILGDAGEQAWAKTLDYGTLALAVTPLARPLSVGLRGALESIGSTIADVRALRGIGSELGLAGDFNALAFDSLTLRAGLSDAALIGEARALGASVEGIEMQLAGARSVAELRQLEAARAAAVRDLQNAGYGRNITGDIVRLDNNQRLAVRTRAGDFLAEGSAEAEAALAARNAGEVTGRLSGSIAFSDAVLGDIARNALTFPLAAFETPFIGVARGLERLAESVGRAASSLGPLRGYANIAEYGLARAAAVVRAPTRLTGTLASRAESALARIFPKSEITGIEANYPELAAQRIIYQPPTAPSVEAQVQVLQNRINSLEAIEKRLTSEADTFGEKFTSATARETARAENLEAQAANAKALRDARAELDALEGSLAAERGLTLAEERAIWNFDNAESASARLSAEDQLNRAGLTVRGEDIVRTSTGEKVAVRDSLGNYIDANTPQGRAVVAAREQEQLALEGGRGVAPARNPEPIRTEKTNVGEQLELPFPKTTPVAQVSEQGGTGVITRLGRFAKESPIGKGIQSAGPALTVLSSEPAALVAQEIVQLGRAGVLGALERVGAINTRTAAASPFELSVSNASVYRGVNLTSDIAPSVNGRIAAPFIEIDGSTVWITQPVASAFNVNPADLQVSPPLADDGSIVSPGTVASLPPAALPSPSVSAVPNAAQNPTVNPSANPSVNSTNPSNPSVPATPINPANLRVLNLSPIPLLQQIASNVIGAFISPATAQPAPQARTAQPVAVQPQRTGPDHVVFGSDGIIRLGDGTAIADAMQSNASGLYTTYGIRSIEVGGQILDVGQLTGDPAKTLSISFSNRSPAEIAATPFGNNIAVNPALFAALPQPMQVFGVLHEMAHFTVGQSEVAADEWAADQAVKNNFISDDGWNQVYATFNATPDMHVPAPQRIETITAARNAARAEAPAARGPLAANRPALIAQRIANWWNGTAQTQVNPTPEFVRRVAYYSIMPTAYTPIGPVGITDILNRVYTGLQSGEHAAGNDLVHPDRLPLFQNRLDAWGTYLGLPQKYGTFSESNFVPAQSSEQVKYLKINKFLQNVAAYNAGALKNIVASSPDAATVQFLLREIQLPSFAIQGRKDAVVASDSANYIMGNYMLSMGQDSNGPYISYYDRWDLDRSPEGRSGLIGTPFEIYDRIYYDPVTFEPIQNVNVAQAAPDTALAASGNLGVGAAEAAAANGPLALLRMADAARAVTQLLQGQTPTTIASALGTALKSAIITPAQSQPAPGAPRVIEALPVTAVQTAPQIPSFSLPYRLRAPSDIEKLPVDQISRDRLIQEVNDVMGRLNKFGADTLPAITGKPYRPATIHTNGGIGHEFYSDGVVVVDVDAWIRQSESKPLYLSNVRTTLAHEVGHHFQRELGESTIGRGRQNWYGDDRSFFAQKQRVEDQADQFAALMMADPEADLLYDGALPQIYADVYGWSGGGTMSTHPGGPSRANRIYDALKYENIGDALKSNQILEKNAHPYASLASLWGINRVSLENMQRNFADRGLSNTRTALAINAWLADDAQNPFRFYSPSSWSQSQSRDEAYLRALGNVAKLIKGSELGVPTQQDERAAIEYATRFLDDKPIGLFASANANKVSAFQGLLREGYADTAIGKALEKWMRGYENRSLFARIFFDANAPARDAALASELTQARRLAGMESATESLATSPSSVGSILDMYNSPGTAAPKTAFSVVDAAKAIAQWAQGKTLGEMASSAWEGVKTALSSVNPVSPAAAGPAQQKPSFSQAELMEMFRLRPQDNEAAGQNNGKAARDFLATVVAPPATDVVLAARTSPRLTVNQMGATDAARDAAIEKIIRDFHTQATAYLKAEFAKAGLTYVAPELVIQTDRPNLQPAYTSAERQSDGTWKKVNKISVGSSYFRTESDVKFAGVTRATIIQTMSHEFGHQVMDALGLDTKIQGGAIVSMLSNGRAARTEQQADQIGGAIAVNTGVLQQGDFEDIWYAKFANGADHETARAGEPIALAGSETGLSRAQATWKGLTTGDLLAGVNALSDIGVTAPKNVADAWNKSSSLADAKSSTETKSPPPAITQMPDYTVIGDSHSCDIAGGCAQTGARSGIRFTGAHIFETAQSLPTVAGKSVVVYLGTNDIGYAAAANRKNIQDFLAKAAANNVKILAWVGPSGPLGAQTTAMDTILKEELAGKVEYVSLTDGTAPKLTGDNKHFTAAGYTTVKQKVDQRILASLNAAPAGPGTASIKSTPFALANTPAVPSQPSAPKVAEATQPDAATAGTGIRERVREIAERIERDSRQTTETQPTIQLAAKSTPLKGAASTYNPNKPGYATGGQRLATGGTYNPNAYEAALQLGLAKRYQVGYGAGKIGYALVESGTRKLILKINDNGPLVPGRIIDLNEASMRYLSNGALGNNSGVLPGVTVTLLEGLNYSAGPVTGDGMVVAKLDKPQPPPSKSLPTGKVVEKGREVVKVAKEKGIDLKDRAITRLGTRGDVTVPARPPEPIRPLAEREQAATQLVLNLKKQNPNITDVELAARVFYNGLEYTNTFEGLRTAVARSFAQGSSQSAINKAYTPGNAAIGKQVAALLKPTAENPNPKLVSYTRAPDSITQQRVMEDYLWSAYQRKSLKVDAGGDYTWKDITGALNARKSLRDYVIGGMNERLKLNLYYAGKAMDADGLNWSFFAAYRGLERPAATGRVVAKPQNSQHYAGGYGFGNAADLSGALGTSDQAVWNWLQQKGNANGLKNHFIANDPAHVQPNSDRKILADQQRKIALVVDETRRLAASQQNQPPVASGQTPPTAESQPPQQRRIFSVLNISKNLNKLRTAAGLGGSTQPAPAQTAQTPPAATAQLPAAPVVTAGVPNDISRTITIPNSRVRTAEFFVPKGANPDTARVVIAVHGNNPDALNTIAQFKSQFAGQNVIVIMPNLGNRPSNFSGDFFRNSGALPQQILGLAQTQLKADTGSNRSLADGSLVLVGYSGGGPVVREMLRSGAFNTRLAQNGSTVVFLGGIYGESVVAAWVKANPQVTVVSVSTNESPEGKSRISIRDRNTKFAQALKLGVPAKEVAAQPFAQGTKAVIADATKSHNALPGNGMLASVLNNTKPIVGAPNTPPVVIAEAKPTAPPAEEVKPTIEEVKPLTPPIAQAANVPSPTLGQKPTLFQKLLAWLDYAEEESNRVFARLAVRPLFGTVSNPAPAPVVTNFPAPIEDFYRDIEQLLARAKSEIPTEIERQIGFARNRINLSRMALMSDYKNLTLSSTFSELPVATANDSDYVVHWRYMWSTSELQLKDLEIEATRNAIAAAQLGGSASGNDFIAFNAALDAQIKARADLQKILLAKDQDVMEQLMKDRQYSSLDALRTSVKDNDTLFSDLLGENWKARLGDPTLSIRDRRLISGALTERKVLAAIDAGLYTFVNGKGIEKVISQTLPPSASVEPVVQPIVIKKESVLAPKPKPSGRTANQNAVQEKALLEDMQRLSGEINKLKGIENVVKTFNVARQRYAQDKDTSALSAQLGDPKLVAALKSYNKSLSEILALLLKIRTSAKAAGITQVSDNAGTLYSDLGKANRVLQRGNEAYLTGAYWAGTLQRELNAIGSAGTAIIGIQNELNSFAGGAPQAITEAFRVEAPTKPVIPPVAPSEPMRASSVPPTAPASAPTEVTSNTPPSAPTAEPREPRLPSDRLSGGDAVVIGAPAAGAFIAKYAGLAWAGIKYVGNSAVNVAKSTWNLAKAPFAPSPPRPVPSNMPAPANPTKLVTPPQGNTPPLRVAPTAQTNPLGNVIGSVQPGAKAGTLVNVPVNSAPAPATQLLRMTPQGPQIIPSNTPTVPSAPTPAVPTSGTKAPAPTPSSPSVPARIKTLGSRIRSASGEVAEWMKARFTRASGSGAGAGEMPLLNSLGSGGVITNPPRTARTMVKSALRVCTASLIRGTLCGAVFIGLPTIAMMIDYDNDSNVAKKSGMSPAELAKKVEALKKANPTDTKIPGSYYCADGKTLCGFKIDGKDAPVLLDSPDGKRIALSKELCNGNEKCYSDALEAAKKANGDVVTPPQTPPSGPGTTAPGGGTTNPGGGTAETGAGAGNGAGGLGALGGLLGQIMKLFPNLWNYFFGPPTQEPIAPTQATSTPVAKTVVTAALIANPTAVDAGKTSKLTWSSVNAKECSIYGPAEKLLAKVETNGSTSTPSLSQSTEFGVVCVAGDAIPGTAKATVRVNGSAEPVVPVKLPTASQLTSQGSVSSQLQNTIGQSTQVQTQSQTTQTQSSGSSQTTPGGQGAGWCDPNLPIDIFVQCLCKLEPQGCMPWKTAPKQ